MNYYVRTLGLVSGVLGLMPAALLGIATYVLSAMAIYTIARRRGLRKPWLAWIPVAGSYLVGSLSDQYRYLVHRQDRSKRKLLLVLSILRAVLLAMILSQAVSFVTRLLFDFLGNRGEEILLAAGGALMRILWLCLPLCAVGIAYAVIRYMALYDIFHSLDPANSTLYLVLSILIPVTEPFFLFFNRGKDGGMPPRKRPAEASQPRPTLEMPSEQPKEPEPGGEPQPAPEPEVSVQPPEEPQGDAQPPEEPENLEW